MSIKEEPQVAEFDNWLDEFDAPEVDTPVVDAEPVKAEPLVREIEIAGEKVKFEAADESDLINQIIKEQNRRIEERLFAEGKQDIAGPTDQPLRQLREVPPMTDDELMQTMFNFNKQPIESTTRLIEQVFGFPVDDVREAILGMKAMEQKIYGAELMNDFTSRHCQFDDKTGEWVGGDYYPTKGNLDKLTRYVQAKGWFPSKESLDKALQDLKVLGSIELPTLEDQSTRSGDEQPTGVTTVGTGLSDTMSAVPDLNSYSVSDQELIRKWESMSSDELEAERRKGIPRR